MSTVRELHDKAMELADLAFSASRKGESEVAVRLFTEAFDFERQAAERIIANSNVEPTRSILLRSAATLALHCGQLRESERMIATALAGNPPQQVINELRDLLEQVYFQRHLDLRGITIDAGEFQFAISGNGIGAGWALSDAFVHRVSYVEKLVYRTAERILQRAFRDRGSVDKSIRENFSLFLSPLRIGSFAVTFKLGRQKHPTLPGLEDMGKDYTEEVVEEIIECLDIVNKGNDDALITRIPEEIYRRNFVALVREIAPDGEEVSQVGFTTVHKGVERRIALRRPRTAVAAIGKPQQEAGRQVDKETQVSVRGRLLLADHRKGIKGHIKLVDSEGDEHKIIVPEGMMSDIVRPLWEYKVEVIGVQKNKSLLLEDIKKAED